MLRPDEVGDVPEDAADGRPGDVDDSKLFPHGNSRLSGDFSSRRGAKAA